MNRSELRAKRKEARRRLRQDAQATRAELKARIDVQMSSPAFAPLLARRARAKRNKRIAALVALLLLLLLLLIECEPEPVAPAVVEKPPAVAQEEPVAVAPKKRVPKRNRRPLKGKIKGSDRSGVDVEPPPPPSWLPKFRLQVAARSPRLAACFNGAEEPGAMRWTTLVYAPSGRAADSVLEPVFRGASIDNAQRECLEQALTSPPYRLQEPGAEPEDGAVGRRVSIIFEF